jgi:hypothetical protein
MIAIRPLVADGLKFGLRGAGPGTSRRPGYSEKGQLFGVLENLFDPGQKTSAQYCYLFICLLGATYAGIEKDRPKWDRWSGC